MGIKFRKSIKIAPGVRLNIGKKSTGISIGNKYGGVSINSKTGVTTRNSIPGTGVSFTQTHKPNVPNIGEKPQPGQAIEFKNNDLQNEQATWTPPEYIPRKFDASAMRLMDTEPFMAYAEEYFSYAEKVADGAPQEIMDDTENQIKLIHQEIERRRGTQSLPNQKNRGFGCGCLVSIIACILFLILLMSLVS